jgi:hypothetical protein
MLEQPTQFGDRAASEGIPSGGDRAVSEEIPSGDIGDGGRHGDLMSTMQ